jgi:hypothetical protein
MAKYIIIELDELDGVDYVSAGARAAQVAGFLAKEQIKARLQYTAGGETLQRIVTEVERGAFSHATIPPAAGWTVEEL